MNRLRLPRVPHQLEVLPPQPQIRLLNRLRRLRMHPQRLIRAANQPHRPLRQFRPLAATRQPIKLLRLAERQLRNNTNHGKSLAGTPLLLAVIRDLPGVEASIVRRS